MDVVKKVVKSEGPLGTSGAIEIALVLTEAWIAGTGLYAGMEATMWRSVSRVSSIIIAWYLLSLRHFWWNGGYFGCIFQVRALLPKPKVCYQFIILACEGGTIEHMLFERITKHVC